MFVADSGWNVSITGGTFELTSGTNVFKINGTDGIFNDETVTGFEIRIKDGAVECTDSGLSETGTLQPQNLTDSRHRHDNARSGGQRLS